MSPLSQKAIEMLRNALTQVEGQAGLTSDDPALLEFKRSVMLNVAALEIAETEAREIGFARHVVARVIYAASGCTEQTPKNSVPSL